MTYEDAKRICRAAFEQARQHAVSREGQAQRVALMAATDRELMDALVVVATQDTK